MPSSFFLFSVFFFFSFFFSFSFLFSSYFFFLCFSFLHCNCNILSRLLFVGTCPRSDPLFRFTTTQKLYTKKRCISNEDFITVLSLQFPFHRVMYIFLGFK